MQHMNFSDLYEIWMNNVEHIMTSNNPSPEGSQPSTSNDGTRSIFDLFPEPVPEPDAPPREDNTPPAPIRPRHRRIYRRHVILTDTDSDDAPLTFTPQPSGENEEEIQGRRRPATPRRWRRVHVSSYVDVDGQVTQRSNTAMMPDDTNTLDTIPCEICSQNIAIDNYLSHVEQCVFRWPSNEDSEPLIRRRQRNTFLPFGGGGLSSFSYMDALSFPQLLRTRFDLNLDSMLQSLQTAANAGNDYEYNLLLQEIMGQVPRGVDDKEALTEVVPCEHIPKEDTCTICLERLDQEADNKVMRKIKKCGHMFCQSCIFTWLENSKKCPNCNTEIDASS